MTDPVQAGLTEALSLWSLAVHVTVVVILLGVNLALLRVARREALFTWVIAWTADLTALAAVLTSVAIGGGPGWYGIYGGAKLCFVLLLLRGILLFEQDRLAFTQLSHNWAVAAGLIFGAVLWTMGDLEAQTTTFLAVGSTLVAGSFIVGVRMTRTRARFLAVSTAIGGALFLHHGFVMLRGLSLNSFPLYMNYISFVDLLGEFLIGLSCLLALGHRAVAEMGRTNQALEASQRALRALVDADPLTGLFNRRRLREFLDSSAEDGGSLVYLDIDDFKGINDRWGHSAGDRALCRLADSLREAFRSRDGLFRIGGDEFLVVAPGIAPEAVEARITALRRDLGSGTKDVVRMSIAVGIVEIQPGVPMEEAMAAADQAMYRDKASRKRV